MVRGNAKTIEDIDTNLLVSNRKHAYNTYENNDKKYLDLASLADIISPINPKYDTKSRFFPNKKDTSILKGVIKNKDSGIVAGEFSPEKYKTQEGSEQIVPILKKNKKPDTQSSLEQVNETYPNKSTLGQSTAVLPGDGSKQVLFFSKNKKKDFWNFFKSV